MTVMMQGKTELSNESHTDRGETKNMSSQAQTFKNSEGYEKLIECPSKNPNQKTPGQQRTVAPPPFRISDEGDGHRCHTRVTPESVPNIQEINPEGCAILVPIRCCFQQPSTSGHFDESQSQITKVLSKHGNDLRSHEEVGGELIE